MRFNSTEEAQKYHIENYHSDGIEKEMLTENSHDWNRFTFIREHIARDKPILDVGCNGGTTLIHFKDKYQCQGIDIVPELVEKAKKRGIFASVGSAEDLSKFNKNAFGTVICTEVLEHLFDPEIAVKEAFRVLSKGGNYIVTVPFNQREKLGDFHQQNFTKESIFNLLAKYFKPENIKMWDIPYSRWYSVQNKLPIDEARWIGIVATK